MLSGLASPALADPALTEKFDQLVQPWVDSGHFSGAILVTVDGSIVFDKAYGFSDVERHISNKTSTSFHIAQLTQQYTAVAAMLQIEKSQLYAGNSVGQLLTDVADGRPTVGELLVGEPYVAGPNYDLLGRILEHNTGKPLADIFDVDFFGPLFLTGSGLDDGSLSGERRMAKGYRQTADAGAELAPPPDWTSHAGSIAAFATTRNELRWLDAFFGDRLVSAATRQAMLEGTGAGYGWRRTDNWLDGKPLYWSDGSAGGFCAYVARFPARNVTVVVLGNVYSGGGSKLGSVLTALATGKAPPPGGP